MDVQSIVNEGWRRHAEAPEAVFAEALAVVEEAPPETLGALANLLFHVGAEHLGRLAPVARAVVALQARATPETAAPLHRTRAALAFVVGDMAAAADHLAEAAGDAATNRGIALGLAAGALAGQSRPADAAARFGELVALAETSPGLHRSAAITANNLAVALEERAGRSPAEDALMLAAAEAARRFWESAGTWMNVERAEYRLAMTRLARGEPDAALAHAERVLAIVAANGDDPGEAFFGWEAVARARHARGEDARAARDAAAACLPRIADEGFRGYCVGALAALDARIA